MKRRDGGSAATGAALLGGVGRRFWAVLDGAAGRCWTALRRDGVHSVGAAMENLR